MPLLVICLVMLVVALVGCARSKSPVAEPTVTAIMSKATSVPSAQPTRTPSPQLTEILTPTTPPARTLTPSSYPTQQAALPPSDCPHMPLGGFYDVWRNTQVWPRLGCAVAPAEPVTGTEAFLCCGAHSLWLREKRLFVAVGQEFSPYWSFVPDESGLPLETPLMVAPTPQLPTPTLGPPLPTPAPTPTTMALSVLQTHVPTPSPRPSQASVVLSSNESPDATPTATLELRPWPRGCFLATGRHGWLANSPDWAEECRGLARSNETPFSGALQQFKGGWLFWNGNVCFVLFADGTWIIF